MPNQYFLPIKSFNLAHYFQNGIISPTNNIGNRNTDVQNIFPNHLLLSSQIYLSDSNCSLEIVFDEEEEKPKRIGEKLFLFNMPLPISRVKKIYFSTNSQKINTLFDIESGAAFIPENLIEIVNLESHLSIDNLNNLKEPTNYNNWGSLLKEYDQILGGFSSMKLAAKNNRTYPKNYFSALGNINNLFKKISQKFQIQQQTDYSWIFEKIDSNNKYENLYNLIHSNLNRETVEEYAKHENVDLQSRNGLIQYDLIPENKMSYYFAILESYGKEKRKKIDSFISDFFSNKFNSKKLEGLSLIFGINKGYSSFRNRYKTENFEFEMKFKLDSTLDYYIIESIYQFVFNDLKSKEVFQYLDSWTPLFQNKGLKNFKTFRVIDKELIVPQTNGDSFYLDFYDRNKNLQRKFFNSIQNISERWIPPFAKLKEYREVSYFETELNPILKKYTHEVYIRLKDHLNYQNEKKNSIIAEQDQEIKKLTLEISNLKKSISNTNSEKKNKNSVNEVFSKSLFPNENSLSKDDRLKTLNKLGITKLKEIAKELDISGISKLKFKDKDKLIHRILKKEFPL